MPSGAPCPALRTAEADGRTPASPQSCPPPPSHFSPSPQPRRTPPNGSPFRLNNADREEKRWRTIEMEDDMDNQR